MKEKSLYKKMDNIRKAASKNPITNLMSDYVTAPFKGVEERANETYSKLVERRKKKAKKAKHDAYDKKWSAARRKNPSNGVGVGY